MVLTQESVLSLLIAEGGKVKKSDFVGKFRGSVDCADPAEKERNRMLFKTFVNNVAVVKEIDGDRYVVVRKTYQHLLSGVHAAEKGENEENGLTGEQQRPPVRGEKPERSRDAGGERPAETDPEEGSPGHPAEPLSPIQLALQRSKCADARVKRMLHFDIRRQDANGDNRGAAKCQSKPFALPLRVPPGATTVEIRKLRGDPDDAPESERRPSLAETGGDGVGSPQLRRPPKSTKATEEPRDTPRAPSLVPLEQSEHEWLVRCAAGHWSRAYGLLLRDSQLADKRDFMSGFTALHWAAKCGNSEMLAKIIDLSKRGGVGVDVNARTHGGYTPLHIAALHDQEYVMAMLVGEYGADPSVRDNRGKRAHHYLHRGVSATLREMLGQPKAPRRAQDGEAPPIEREEPDLFQDLPKGLHSISRLFQPHATGHKKKHKQRPPFFSLSDDPGEDRGGDGGSGGGGGGSFRHRVISEAFM